MTHRDEEHWPRLTHLSRNRGPVQGASETVRESDLFVRTIRAGWPIFYSVLWRPILIAASYEPTASGRTSERERERERESERERERERGRERERERERQYQFEFSGESSVDLDANCDSWPPRMKNTLLPLRWCFSDDYMTLMERNFYSLKARALVKKSSALQRRIY